MLLFLTAESRSEDTIKYDGPNNSGFGRPGGGTFYSAVRFHPVQSCTLKSIIFYQYQPVTAPVWIYLHEEGSPITPGEKLDSISYLGMPGPSAWIRLNFPTPHFRAGGVDFWIIVKITHAAGQLPLGVDAGPSVSPPHSFVSPDGNIWQTLPAFGQNRNFNIRAIVRYIQPMRDMGIDEIISPNTQVSLYDTITLTARVKNYGASSIINCPVTFLYVVAGCTTWATTLNVVLAAGESIEITFDSWTANFSGSITLVLRTGDLDDVPANNCEARTVSIIYLQDFELYNGCYFQDPPTGGWEWGVPTSGPTSAYSGTTCWGTVLDGNYLNNANWTLTSAFIFYATSNNPVLKFRHWYNMENNLDGGNVKISTYPCTTWQLIKPIWGYNGTASSSNAGIPGESCYTGIDTTWTEEIFIIPVDSGQYFLVRWHFGSDCAVTFPGWYIDHVTGVGFTGPYLYIGLTIMSPGSTHHVNIPMTPRVQIRNFGGSVVTLFPVVCSIVGAYGTLRYSNTQTVGALNPGSSIYVNFSSWTPTVVELCTVKVRTLNARVTTTTLITTSILIEGFNDPMFPPPGWQRVIVQGLNTWERNTGQGPVWPVEGLGMACYPVFFAPAGSQARLISPAIDVGTTLNPCSLKFFMYHDAAYPGPPTSARGPDSLKVEYSTDGSNFTRVAAYRRYEPNANWVEHTLYLGTFSGTIYLGFLAYSEYGNHIFIDYVRMVGAVSGIEHQNGNNVIATALFTPKPNPVTNAPVLLSFSLAEPSQVSLKVFDASGKLVKTLVNEYKNSGVYDINWNCRDDYSRKVAEGIYFYILETPKQKFCRKMVLMQN
jgi:hypothetical protein